MRSDNPRSRPYAFRFIRESTSLVKAIVASWVLASTTLPLGVDEPPPNAAVLLAPPPAQCGRPASECALGLLVPGAGPTVTRASALASLLRGKVRQANIGGVPSGPPLVAVADVPRRVTLYVTLPPPGRHHNVR